MGRLRDSVAQAFGGLPATYWYLWTGVLITRLGTLVIPFLSVYLTLARGLDLRTAGLIVSLYGVGSTVAGLSGGWLADHVGRRRTLLLGLTAAAFAMLGLGLARGLWVTAGMTLVLGLFSDLGRPAVAALIADVVPPEQRVRAYALHYWAVNIGFSVAPVVAGLLVTHSFLVLFLADAGTTLLYAVVVFLRIPETRPPQPGLGHAPGAPARVALRDPELLAFCGLTVGLGLIFFQFNTALPLDMQAKGMGPATYGSVVAVNGLLIVLLQPFVTRHLKGRRRGRVLALAGLLVGGGFALGRLCHSPLAFAGSVMVWTCGELLSTPVGSALVADLAPPHARGRYQGLYSTGWSVATVLAPVLGTWVLARWGSGVLWPLCLALGALVAVGHLAAAPARRRRLNGRGLALD